MKNSAKTGVIYATVAISGLLALVQDAAAVPSYARRYGEECSTCHSMWGALTPAGLTFKLSGYRAIFGKDMTPVTPDQEISKNVVIPTTLPLSFITGVGIDSRSESRSGTGDATVGSTNSNGSSWALEDASIFMTSPLGKHLSAFVEFPMYETRAWEFTPTGNYDARFHNAGRQIQFGTEQPIFEVAKFFWNNPFDGVSRDSVNFLAGITQLPLGYPSGKVRIAANQYLIYERTSLDLISPRRIKDGVFSGDPNDNMFRMSEAQGLGEVYGMTTFGKPVTDVSKKDTLWAEYHLGLSNGANAKAANHSQKDIYGRVVFRYYGQGFGLFGLSGSDTYSDDLRQQGSFAGNTTAPTAGSPIGNIVSSGIMSGQQNANKTKRFGPDLTLSLVPFGVPIWMENQYMVNSDSDPTGFGTAFKWRGGFHQINWKTSTNSLLYLRYDYVRGDAYDDTTSTVKAINTNGLGTCPVGGCVGGITKSTPREKDWILGFQHLVDQNTKLLMEYRTHTFDDTASGSLGGAASSAANFLGVTGINAAHLKDNGFTVRMMFGF